MKIIANMANEERQSEENTIQNEKSPSETKNDRTKQRIAKRNEEWLYKKERQNLRRNPIIRI